MPALYFLILCAWLTAGAAVAQNHAPEDAVRRMQLPADLQVQLVASEPMIAQPVCVEFDDRGRLWVMQYLQYPNPAGLKRTTVDRWSRTTYDRVPEPPPRGPKGADRITILEDTDGDGRADRAHDFVNGLNLATGIAFGHGGVFVLNVPYLLFYPDSNRDDVPDAKPEVCLEGFGMEDAHSVANSLTWGPDGWLYGCQGSTVTARIRGIEFQQGVWRYHPLTREFELFCEGGGNSWGLDFDADGELIYSTNLGPYRNLHGVQGANYWKSFGKHGALHNPYAFGYFDHIAHTNFTGGHVTDGGIIYQGTNLPARFHNRFLCGDLLGHGVQWHEMFRQGSTFTSAHGGYLLAANDAWFAPTDVTMSADNALYVTDWHDQRTAHPDPDAEWDRSNGRVYRISAKGTQPSPAPDIGKLTTPQLIALLDNPNDWLVRKARRVLADRRDAQAVAPLRALVLETRDDRLALQALWALHVSGGLDETVATQTLRHRSASVRQWTVRLLGDAKRAAPGLVDRLVELAKTDPDVRVRSQLAGTAQRLPPGQGLPVVEALLRRDVDAEDAQVPLRLWWAIERHALDAVPALEKFFTSPPAWQSRIAREVIMERLVRRWVAADEPAAYAAAIRLLAAAPDAAQRQRLVGAMAQGFHDRPAGNPAFGTGGLFARTEVAGVQTATAAAKPRQVPEVLRSQLTALWREDTTDLALIHLGLHAGHDAALARTRALVSDAAAPRDLRAQLISLLAEQGDSADAARLLRLLANSTPETVQLAALEALPGLQPPDLAADLLKLYPQLGERVRARVRQVLLSRKNWAGALLREVDAGRMAPDEFAPAQLRIVALHEDPALDELVRRHWGRLSSGTAEEKLAEMRRLNNDLNAGRGDPARGHALFTRLCAACHTLRGEGGHAGPDLTVANRADREFLLASIVDPSAAIRKEYLTHDVETRDGRLLAGVITAQGGGNLTLAIATGERIVIPQAQVVSLRESAVSLMPEGLAQALKPQELRDLFAYLQQ